MLVLLFDSFVFDVQIWIIFEFISEFLFPNLFPNFFCEIFASSKKRIFPKNFQTSITEIFRNPRKQKVRKIPSFAGPYCKYQKSPQETLLTHNSGRRY